MGLVDSLKPFFAVFLGWAFLGEKDALESWAFAGGLAITSLGVVLTAREADQPHNRDKPATDTEKLENRTPADVDQDVDQENYIGEENQAHRQRRQQMMVGNERMLTQHQRSNNDRIDSNGMSIKLDEKLQEIKLENIELDEKLQEI